MPQNGVYDSRTDEERQRAAERAQPVINALRSGLSFLAPPVRDNGVVGVTSPNKPLNISGGVGLMNPPPPEARSDPGVDTLSSPAEPPAQKPVTPIPGLAPPLPAVPKPVNSMPGPQGVSDINSTITSIGKSAVARGVNAEKMVPESPYYDIAPSPGGLTYTPKGVGSGLSQWRDASGNIHIEGGGPTGAPTGPSEANPDQQIDKVMATINDLVESATTGKLRGMKQSTFGKIVELRKSQLTAALGAQGHKATQKMAELGLEDKKEGRADRAEAAKERSDINRERVAETKRYNDIRAEDVDLTRQQANRLKEEADALRKTQGEDTLIKTFGQYQDADGVSTYHPGVAIFKLIDSGYDTATLSPQYQAIATRMKTQFQAYAAAQKKSNPKLTPSQIKSAFYAELTGRTPAEK